MGIKIKVNTDDVKVEDIKDDISALTKKELSIEELLIYATDHNCSDLYIKVGDYPYISRYSKIQRLPCVPISKDAWHIFYSRYVLNEFHAGYVREKLFDTSIEVRVPEGSPGRAKGFLSYRYRVSFGFSEEANIATFRMIKPDKVTFDKINFNPQCVSALKNAYDRDSGICFMTGPTGSGKSTTLAACINTFTQKNDILDNKVLITLEDPIENIFYSTDSVKINQKELGKDFTSFGLGIKAALREHPNIIIVGECRDKEVICTAIEAGRTGHLVSTSFHASDVGGTVSRLLYHLDNDKNLSFDLIKQLNIIMSQRMIKQEDRYLVDTQYLLFDDTIRDHLIKLIETPNVAYEVEKLVKNPELIKSGMSKDWQYQHNH